MHHYVGVVTRPWSTRSHVKSNQTERQGANVTDWQSVKLTGLPPTPIDSTFERACTHTFVVNHVPKQNPVGTQTRWWSSSTHRHTHTHCLPVCPTDRSACGVSEARGHMAVNGHRNARTDLPGVLDDGPMVAVVTRSFSSEGSRTRANPSVRGQEAAN